MWRGRGLKLAIAVIIFLTHPKLTLFVLQRMCLFDECSIFYQWKSI